MLQRQRGFTYLIMLFFVAITAAALAALGQSWHNAAEREREAELAFRGGEIARAIDSYAKAPVNGQTQYPRTLDDLLTDRRGPKERHHLRRAYPDPFTGAADWVLAPLPGDPTRFNAVHSRSDQVLLRSQLHDGTPVHQAKDWVFTSGNLVANSAPNPPIAPASQPASL